MKAAVYDTYGPPEVIRVAEVDRPACKDGEVLVRVHAATVSSGDWRTRALKMPPGFGLLARPMFGFTGPRNKILGTDFAGVVEAVAPGVTSFAPGDAVFGSLGFSTGSHAEYVVVSAGGAIAHKPDTVSYAEAAALPFGGATALHFLRDRGRMRPAEHILINGASGAVGSAAVQIAKAMDLEVTAVCSKANADLVSQIGADHIIDYHVRDFAADIETYDAIMDTVGNAPFKRCKPALKPGGRLLAVLAGLGTMIMAPWQSLTSGRKVCAGPVSESPEGMAYLAELAAEGRLRPVIDSVFTLEEVVAAHTRVDSGHKRGNVVLALVPDESANADGGGS